jgi:hypothetical protein
MSYFQRIRWKAALGALVHNLPVSRRSGGARRRHARLMTLPPEALELAARQYGVLSRTQLLRWLSPPSLEGKVRRRAFEPLERGVYRVTDGVAVAGQAAVAAALRCGPGAVLTGPFVLGHHRVEGFDLDAPFEILVPGGRQVRNVTFPMRRDRDPGRALELIGEVRLASKVDALLDTGRHLGRYSERQLRRAYDQLRFVHGVRTSSVERRIAARGVADPAVATFLGAVGDPVVEGEGERALAPLLGRLEPTPEPQVWVTPRRRVDFYLRALRFGWEYLGEVDHRRAAERRADAVRDEELAAQHVRLHYVVAADLRDPTAFLASTMAALAHRAEQLGARMPTLRPARGS